MNTLGFKLKSIVSVCSCKTGLLINIPWTSISTTCNKSFSSKTKLEHVGVLKECKQDCIYEIGQTFLHRVFAYRGIILHSWPAHIYERNRDLTNFVNQDDEGAAKKSVPKMETYYQVLVDSRDSANLSCHSSEAVTFLTNPKSENRPLFYTIPGIDYVSHEDVIPYLSCEEVPLHHDLYEKFLENRGNKQMLQATETFNNWQKKNQVCLELNNVHRETTDNIRVTAIPFYLGADQSPNRVQPSEYWWRYCVRIENLCGTNAHLRESYWRIITNGTVSTRRGLGVMGREPVLSSEQPAFQVSSRPLSLPTSSGQMWGTFRLEREDGEQFDVRIPAFSLESKVPSETDSSSVGE